MNQFEDEQGYLDYLARKAANRDVGPWLSGTIMNDLSTCNLKQSQRTVFTNANPNPKSSFKKKRKRWNWTTWTEEHELTELNTQNTNNGKQDMKTLNTELTTLNTNMTALNHTRERSQNRYELTVITALGITIGLLMNSIPDTITILTTAF